MTAEKWAGYGRPELSSGGQEPGRELAQSKCVQLFEALISARGSASTAKLHWCAVSPPKVTGCAHGGGTGSGLTMVKPSFTSPKRKERARCAFWAVLGGDEGMEAHLFPQQDPVADFLWVKESTLVPLCSSYRSGVGSWLFPIFPLSFSQHCGFCSTGIPEAFALRP